MASFPASLYTAPTLGALMSNTPTHSTVHNDANAEVQAIEATLGVNPQGSSATVTARFDATVAAPVSTWAPTITAGTGVTYTVLVARTTIFRGGFIAQFACTVTGGGTGGNTIVITTPATLVNINACGGTLTVVSAGTIREGGITATSTTAFAGYANGGGTTGIGGNPAVTLTSGDAIRATVIGWTA